MNNAPKLESTSLPGWKLGGDEEDELQGRRQKPWLCHLVVPSDLIHSGSFLSSGATAVSICVHSCDTVYCLHCLKKHECSWWVNYKFQLPMEWKHQKIESSMQSEKKGYHINKRVKRELFCPWSIPWMDIRIPEILFFFFKADSQGPIPAHSNENV